MDLLTQGLLGASLAGAAAPARELRLAAGVGFASGLLADADTLIRSSNDPLLVLEYHRHFSHALLFVPLGALIASLLLWPLLGRRLAFPRLYGYALLGYALSGVLDACTSYGTRLWWPLSDQPVAWNLIAVVDPLFSLALLLPLIIALRRRRAALLRLGLILAALYLSLAVIQQQRATTLARDLATTRGHSPESLLVKPTIGNLVLWRSVYAVDKQVQVDAVHVGLPGRTRIYPGESLPLFHPEQDLPGVSRDSRLWADIQRFSALSRGMVVRHPDRLDLLGDVRYAMLTTSAKPLWGIVVDPTQPEQVPAFVTHRKLSPGEREAFLSMLLGNALSSGLANTP